MSFAVWFSSCQYFVALISVDTVDLASWFWWSLSVLSSDRIHRSLSVHTPTCRQWGCFRVGVCLVAQSCPTLFDPMDCSSPSSSVHGILQARILEWAAISYSEDLSNPGFELMSLVSPALAGGFFTTVPPRNSCFSLQSTTKQSMLSTSKVFTTHLKWHTSRFFWSKIICWKS